MTRAASTPSSLAWSRQFASSQWTTACIAALALCVTARAEAGTWKHEAVPHAGNVLTYTEDGKITFYISCGRGFAIDVIYPGAAQTEGAAEITIVTSKGRQNLKGAFEQPAEVNDPGPRNFATTFKQLNLGYPRNDPGLFGPEFNARKGHLLDLIDAQSPITVLAGNQSHQYPAIDVADDWHRLMDICKY
jgi:hypothetical protein